jgi:hypothetical protein
MLTPEISIQQMNDNGSDAVNGKLLMQVSARAFAYMVVTDGNELGVYEKFSFSAVGFEAELPGLLTNLPWMHKKYNQVKTVYFTHEATVVPARLYDTDKAPLHLDLLYGNLGDTKQLADFVADEKAYCVYRVLKTMLRPVVRNFPVAGSWHALSLLLGGKQPREGDSIALHFMQDACCMAFYRGPQLMAAKAMHFAHYMDVLYYLLSLCQQQGFDPETLKMEISGRITEGSPLYEEMRKYFRYINFTTTGYRVAEAEAPYPPHFFYMFHLLSNAL